jgi:hypothetical protein
MTQEPRKEVVGECGLQGVLAVFWKSNGKGLFKIFMCPFVVPFEIIMDPNKIQGFRSGFVDLEGFLVESLADVPRFV